MMNKFEYYILLSKDRTKIINLGCIINLNLYTVKNYLMYDAKVLEEMLVRIKQISKGKDQLYRREDHISFAKKQLALKPTITKVELKI